MQNYGYSDYKKIVRNTVIIILFLSLFINIMADAIENGRLLLINCRLSVQDNEIRMMHLDFSFENAVKRADDMKVSVGEYITVLMVLHDYEVTDEDINSLSKGDFIRLRNRLVRLKADDFIKISRIYTEIINDFTTFPVPKSKSDNAWIKYCDSWGNERTYGGERRHEGTDLMADRNEAGVYPVLSVGNGIITNIGWLELGGYRIGITSENGIYYYYAHMASYANLKEGDTVTAGQFLGFMGNTGYSKVEGTSGKFDVHLHFGIYLPNSDKDDLAVNPYFILKHTENKVLYYNY